MKTYKNIVFTILFISVVGYALNYAVNWVMNPELTQMQIFLKHWIWFVVNIGLLFWSRKLNNY